jgi:hypothetical protein
MPCTHARAIATLPAHDPHGQSLFKANYTAKITAFTPVLNICLLKYEQQKGKWSNSK